MRVIRLVVRKVLLLRVVSVFVWCVNALRVVVLNVLV